MLSPFTRPKSHLWMLPAVLALVTACGRPAVPEPQSLRVQGQLQGLPDQNAFELYANAHATQWQANPQTLTFSFLLAQSPGLYQIDDWLMPGPELDKDPVVASTIAGKYNKGVLVGPLKLYIKNRTRPEQNLLQGHVVLDGQPFQVNLVYFLEGFQLKGQVTMDRLRCGHLGQKVVLHRDIYFYDLNIQKGWNTILSQVEGPENLSCSPLAPTPSVQQHRITSTAENLNIQWQVVSNILGSGQKIQ